MRRRGGTPRIRVEVLSRAAVALTLLLLLLPTPRGTADEIQVAVDSAADPVIPPTSVGITCLSAAQISFYPPAPQPERVVRIDVLSPSWSGQVMLLSSLPLYFESELQEWNGYRWSWFTWVPEPGA